MTDLKRDRNDTANGIGGGLLVYARNGLAVLPCDENSDFNQYCKFKVTDKSESIYIYLLYRPPNAGQASKDKLCELLSQAEKNSLFIGDFNLPGVDWEAGAGHGVDIKIVQVVQEHDFTQMVDFPTHIRGGGPGPDPDQHARKGEQYCGSRQTRKK